MKIEKDESLSIEFGEGMGQSVLSNFTDIMGVNIADTPGVASVNLKFQKVQEDKDSSEVEFLGDDFVNMKTGTADNRGSFTGRAVVFSSTGALPTGLTSGKVYYICSRGTGLTNKHFRVSASLKQAMLATGSHIAITGAGTGVHSMEIITPTEITAWAKNGQGKIFALDSEQNLWFCGDGVTNPWYLIERGSVADNGSGNGLIYYKGYFLVFHDSGIDALTDMQSVTEDIDWEYTFNSVVLTPSKPGNSRGACPILSVNDDTIYFSNDKASDQRSYQLGMLEEVPLKTFSPLDLTTFSIVGDAIRIPIKNGDGVITAIKELGENLLLGTNTDRIFIWDRKSPTFIGSIKLQERYIQAIEVIGDFAYAFIKDSGSIYVCNTESSSLLLKMPEYLANQYYFYSYTSKPFTVGDTDVYKREVLFTIRMETEELSSISKVKNYLMSYNVDTGQLTKKNISSFGEITGDGNIYSIFVNGRNILMSSSDYNVTKDRTVYVIESLYFRIYSIDAYYKYNVYNNYEPYIITGLVSIGEVYNKKTFRELQISFTRNLIEGQGIRVLYRKDDIGTWNLLKEINHSVNGGIKDIKIPAPITDIIDLQIRIELMGNNYNPYTSQESSTSPKLKLIRLIP